MHSTETQYSGTWSSLGEQLPKQMTMTGKQPAKQADELGMLLQTEFHYPKRSKEK
jgi:hypothetical protein